MKHASRIIRAAVVAVVLGLTTLSRSSSAQTPDLLIKSLLEAAQRGDVEAFLKGLTADSRKAVMRSIENRRLLADALEQVQKALDETLGPRGETLNTPDEDLQQAIGRLAGAEIVERKDRSDGSVELRIKTSLKRALRTAAASS